MYNFFTSMPSSIRQRQVAQQIKIHFSQVLQHQGMYIYGATPLVTITHVEVSPDLSLANIYLSIYNTENKQEVLLELQANKALLKKELAQRLRKHLRRCPDIRFFIDDLLDEMYKLDALFDGLKDKESEE